MRHKINITVSSQGNKGSLVRKSVTVDVSVEDFDDIASAARKHALLLALPDSVKFHKKWDEYVSEAEHGDGMGYWDNFRSAKGVAADFKLYVKALDE